MGIKEDIERLREFDDDEGELGQLADSLERQFDASPLRTENKELKKQAQQAVEQAEKLRSYALSASFKEVGLKVKPDVLKLPDDLDPTDTQALSAWATEAGFIDAKPDTSKEEQGAHEAMQQAAAGGATSPVLTGKAAILEELDPRNLTEEEFWAKAADKKLTLDTQR